MCDQPRRDRLSRRSLLAASGALAAAGTLLPGVAFAEQPDIEPSGEQTRTVTGTLRPDVPDWYYLPVDVPPGVREIEVGYSYDRPQVPPRGRGNALDIGIFSPAGVQLGNQHGFRARIPAGTDRARSLAPDPRAVHRRPAGSHLHGQRHAAVRPPRPGLRTQPGPGHRAGP
jgi:hypothetical protein